MKSLLLPIAIVPLLLLPVAAAADVTDGYVGFSTTDSCSPFDLALGTEGPAIDLLPEGDYPYDATIKPDGSEVWIVGASGDGVVVIDRATNAVTARIAVANYVIGVAFTSDGSLALVTSRDEECVKLIDTATYAVVGSTQLPTGRDAGNIALEPVSGRFYVVDWYDSWLFELSPDGTQILRQADVGNSLWQLVAAPDGAHVYLTDRGTDQVREISTATLTETRAWPVGDDPWGLDVTQDGSTLVVTCEDSHEAMLIQVATGAVTPVALDATADPRDVDILDAEGLAYVTGGAVTGQPDGLYVIDLETGAIADVFGFAGGSNANVVAVQAQMHAPSIGVGDTPLLVAAELAAHPNPFNPQVTVELRLAAPATGTLAVFDAAGRRVRVLVAGAFADGARSCVWDGRDEAGRSLPSGVYLVRFAGGQTAASHKVVLAR